MIYVLIAFVVILFVVDYVINYNEKARMIKKIPGLKNHFLIGNMLEIIVSPVELFRMGRRLASKNNGIYSFYSFMIAAVNIFNPEDIEIIISGMKHHEKSEVYELLRPWLRDGLLMSNGSKWQQRRKILTSAFHFNVLRQYYVIIQENSQRLVELLEKAGGNSTNVTSVISESTLHTICESAMGTQLDNEKSSAGRAYKEAIQNIIKVLFHRFIKIYLYPDICFKLTNLGKLQSKYLAVMHGFTQKVIESRRKAIENNEVEVIEFEEDLEDIQYNSKKKKVAMLDLLISAEKDGCIDKTGIQEEVDTFMFEGHDTVASGITFFLLSVANDSEIQEKIVAELQEIFGDTKRAATMDDLNQMHYLERCIKETLRLYPPVPFISRRLCETTKLSNYTVPEGTFIHIHIYDLHRRPDLFENPLQFNPDRFLPENCAKRHTFAYIPFSAGPRNCIGQKFAMMEMKSVLSAILRNFELVPVTKVSDLVFTADIILRNSEPIFVKFIKRKNEIFLLNKMLYVLTAVVIFLFTLDYLLNHNNKAVLLKKIPGNKSYFIIGNALEILETPVNLFRKGRDWALKYNSIYRFYAFSLGAVNIYTPEDIEVAISSMKHHYKSDIYALLRPWLRSGLLLSDGEKWHQRRKILTNAFHFNVLRQYFVIFEENGQRLVDVLNKSSGEAVSVVPVMSEYTLNSLCESAMGTQLDDKICGTYKTYKEAIHGIVKVIINRFIKLYLYSDIIFNLTSMSKLQAKYLSVMHNFTDSVIKTRKEAIENNEVQNIEFDADGDNIHYTSKKKKAAMLDLLIAAEKDGSIDKIGIQEEVDTFMFEGHDTSSAGLTYALLSIANNQEVQDKIVAELRGIFGETKRAAAADDLMKMQYLERCIKESLRLYPPVPFIGRKLSETIQLSNYTVPAGTLCHIHIYDLHRRADLYENPLKFDPDRFLPENCKNRHTFAYIPFSAGPRNCIGQKFAMMEMKSALAAILRNFELFPITTPDKLKFTADLVLRNSEPVYVKFIARKNKI
ncbi:uncharacterized protein [Epargyreus clarus]|uniref:uncharacterized protein n=1 Tax=Epargyreus clarus TaxID=520877 RepID=UPI003C2F4635